MSRTTLQIPLDTTLRNKAEKAAILAGFSSVQEMVRVFLNKLASQTIDVKFYDKSQLLSQEAEKRYIPLVNDAIQEKNLVRGKSLDDLISILD